MVALAESRRPTRQALAPPCVGSGSCAPGKNPVLHTDRNQQYSSTALTNASGTIVERYAYTAYGQPAFFDGSGTAISASAESNRYTYTGREWDEELHLYHYRARMYDAVAGRFCSRDPIGFEGSCLNFQCYALQNPLKWMDFLGLCPNDDSEEEEEGPCGDKEVAPGVVPTIELCKTLLGSLPLINDPTDICNFCKKLPGNDTINPVKKLCKDACKKAKDAVGVPSVKGEIIKAACCSGTLPEGIPAAPCLKKLYENGQVPRDRDVRNCTACCFKELSGSAASLCNKACQANAGGF